MAEMKLCKKVISHTEKTNPYRKIKHPVKIKSILLLCALVLSLTGCAGGSSGEKEADVLQDQSLETDVLQDQPLKAAAEQEVSLSLSEIPAYSGSPYVELEGNLPSFTTEEITTESFEEYSDLDNLGRCGTAYANICRELMPEEDREGIGHIRPSGWHTVKYPEVIKDNYLYNRCHLIGFQLAGENANEKNLITGTRYFNVDGMLPFEDRVAEYVRESGNHVLYRVTPVYDGSNLVADGVEMEAWSVEDSGKGVCFHVFVYNVQPGIEIDYATGESRLSAASQSEDTAAQSEDTAVQSEDTVAQSEDTASQSEDIAVQSEDAADADADTPEQTYILNTNTMKFHKTNCRSVKQIKEDNKEEYTGVREALLEQGYEPCGNCHP